MVVVILIVAKPGRLRDALYALLKAASLRDIVGQVDDGPVALKVVAEYDPSLVLLDSLLSDDEVKTMVGQIKACQPQTRCLVLANTVEQQQVAKRAGADEVVLKGFPTTNLLGVIDKLMSQPQKLTIDQGG